jgi:hypothetical protein
MFGYSRLFRSRWKALIWAAGILWFAVQIWAPDDSAASPPPDANLQNVME